MTTNKRTDSGFTLIEILVALALTGIVLGAIYAAYQSQHKTYITQESVAEMQQNLRAAMYLMVREIRMAGYDPRGTAGAGIEQRWRRTHKVETGQYMIKLYGARFTVNFIHGQAHGDAHEKCLGQFDAFFLDMQEIAIVECL